MEYVMTVTIQLEAILTMGIAVHLMQIWSMGVGISIAQHVNVFSLLLQQKLQLLQQ